MLKGVHLTLLMGPIYALPVPRPVVDALTEVEVTVAAGAASGFRLSFTISNRSILQQTLLVAATSIPLMRTIIALTVNSIPSVLMDGVITNHEIAAGDKPGESTLTVMGEDLSKLMDLQDLSGLPFPGMPAQAQVNLIVGKYAVFGLTPAVVPPIFFEVKNPVEQIQVQEGTDLNYVTTLADKVGYVFYTEPGPLPGTSLAYWGPQIKIGVPQPALNLDMDAHRNVESLSFSLATSSSELPVVLIQNPLTKAPIPVPLPKINPLQPPLGLLAPPPTKVTVLKDVAKNSPVEALGKGVARQGQSQDGVTGKGTLDVARYGHVLKARSLVGVRGAGVAFDGLYYVKSVTSTLKRGEFKQSFDLTRNGVVSTLPRVPA